LAGVEQIRSYQRDVEEGVRRSVAAAVASIVELDVGDIRRAIDRSAVNIGHMNASMMDAYAAIYSSALIRKAEAMPYIMYIKSMRESIKNVGEKEDIQAAAANLAFSIKMLEISCRHLNDSDCLERLQSLVEKYREKYYGEEHKEEIYNIDTFIETIDKLHSGDPSTASQRLKEVVDELANLFPAEWASERVRVFEEDLNKIFTAGYEAIRVKVDEGGWSFSMGRVTKDLVSDPTDYRLVRGVYEGIVKPLHEIYSKNKRITIEEAYEKLWKEGGLIAAYSLTSNPGRNMEAEKIFIQKVANAITDPLNKDNILHKIRDFNAKQQNQQKQNTEPEQVFHPTIVLLNNKEMSEKLKNLLESKNIDKRDAALIYINHAATISEILEVVKHGYKNVEKQIIETHQIDSEHVYWKSKLELLKNLEGVKSRLKIGEDLRVNVDVMAEIKENIWNMYDKLLKDLASSQGGDKEDDAKQFKRDVVEKLGEFVKNRSINKDDDHLLGRLEIHNNIHSAFSDPVNTYALIRNHEAEIVSKAALKKMDTRVRELVGADQDTGASWGRRIHMIYGLAKASFGSPADVASENTAYYLAIEDAMKGISADKIVDKVKEYEELVKKGEWAAMNYEATDASRVGRFLRVSGAAATAMILEWLAGTGREVVFDPSSYIAYRVRDASGDVKEFHVPQMLAAMERVSVRSVKANIEDYMERLSNRISEEVWNNLSDDIKKSVKMEDLRVKIYGMLDTSKEEVGKPAKKILSSLGADIDTLAITSNIYTFSGMGKVDKNQERAWVSAKGVIIRIDLEDPNKVDAISFEELVNAKMSGSKDYKGEDLSNIAEGWAFIVNLDRNEVNANEITKNIGEATNEAKKYKQKAEDQKISDAERERYRELANRHEELASFEMEKLRSDRYAVYVRPSILSESIVNGAAFRREGRYLYVFVVAPNDRIYQALDQKKDREENKAEAGGDVGLGSPIAPGISIVSNKGFEVLMKEGFYNLAADKVRELNEGEDSFWEGVSGILEGGYASLHMANVGIGLGVVNAVRKEYYEAFARAGDPLRVSVEPGTKKAVMNLSGMVAFSSKVAELMSNGMSFRRAAYEALRDEEVARQVASSEYVFAVASDLAYNLKNTDAFLSIAGITASIKEMTRSHRIFGNIAERLAYTSIAFSGMTMAVSPYILLTASQMLAYASEWMAPGITIMSSMIQQFYRVANPDRAMAIAAGIAGSALSSGASQVGMVRRWAERTLIMSH
jgi:hypothetical protein